MRSATRLRLSLLRDLVAHSILNDDNTARNCSLTGRKIFIADASIYITDAFIYIAGAAAALADAINEGNDDVAALAESVSEGNDAANDTNGRIAGTVQRFVG
jgi:ribonuclease PH